MSDLTRLASAVRAATSRSLMYDAARFAAELLRQGEIAAELAKQADALPPSVLEARTIAIRTPAMHGWKNLSAAAQELIADLARQNGAAEALSAIVGPLPPAAGEATEDRFNVPLSGDSGPAAGYSPLTGQEMAALDDGRTVPRRSELAGR